MFCMKCGTRLPDDAVFCFKCGQKVGGNDLVAETMQPVVTDSTAGIINKGQNSADLVAYLKDVWTVSQKIIEVDYAINNQERKYSIFKSAIKSGNRTFDNFGGAGTYGLAEWEQNARRTNGGFEHKRDMEEIFKYSGMGIVVFPWEINIFQELFQCFGEYFTLEKATKMEMQGTGYKTALPRLLAKNGLLGVGIYEYIDFVGGTPYIFRWNPCSFDVQKGMREQDASMIENLEKMTQNLVNIYREHPQWFTNIETKSEGFLESQRSFVAYPSDSRRWRALRSTLVDAKLDEMRNVFKNAPKKQGQTFRLFSSKSSELNGEYWEEVKQRFPYLQCITPLDRYYDRKEKKVISTTAFVREENDIIKAVYEDVAYVAYPNTVMEATCAILRDKKYDEILNDIQSNITELKNLRRQLVELLNKIYAKGNIHPKYHHNYIASAMFYEYVDTKRCSQLEGANGAYNLFEYELRMDTIIGQLDIVITKLDSIDKTMKCIAGTVSSISGSLRSINARASMIEYNTRMLAMRQDIVNVSASVSSRY